MKQSRATLLALMEILYVLREGPMFPNRLSQVCNLNYQRAMDFLGKLEKKGLISRESKEGHELFRLTPNGLKVSMNFQWINSMVMGEEPFMDKMPQRGDGKDKQEER